MPANACLCLAIHDKSARQCPTVPASACRCLPKPANCQCLAMLPNAGKTLPMQASAYQRMAYLLIPANANRCLPRPSVCQRRQRSPTPASACQSLQKPDNGLQHLPACQCLQMPASACPCLPMLASACECVRMLDHACQCLPVFANPCQCLQMHARARPTVICSRAHSCQQLWIHLTAFTTNCLHCSSACANGSCSDRACCFCFSLDGGFTFEGLGLPGIREPERHIWNKHAFVMCVCACINMKLC